MRRALGDDLAIRDAHYERVKRAFGEEVDKVSEDMDEEVGRVFKAHAPDYWSNQLSLEMAAISNKMDLLSSLFDEAKREREILIFKLEDAEKARDRLQDQIVGVWKNLTEPKIAQFFWLIRDGLFGGEGKENWTNFSAWDWFWHQVRQSFKNLHVKLLLYHENL